MARKKVERTAVRLISPSGARVTVGVGSEPNYVARGYKPLEAQKGRGSAKPAKGKAAGDTKPAEGK